MGLEGRGPVLFALCLSLSLVRHPAHGRHRTRQTLMERAKEQVQWGEGVTVGTHTRKRAERTKPLSRGLFHPRSPRMGLSEFWRPQGSHSGSPFPLPQFRVDSPGGGWTCPRLLAGGGCELKCPVLSHSYCQHTNYSSPSVN